MDRTNTPFTQDDEQLLAAVNNEISHLLRRKSLETTFSHVLTMAEGQTKAFISQYMQSNQLMTGIEEEGSDSEESGSADLGVEDEDSPSVTGTDEVNPSEVTAVLHEELDEVNSVGSPPTSARSPIAGSAASVASSASSVLSPATPIPGRTVNTSSSVVTMAGSPSTITDSPVLRHPVITQLTRSSSLRSVNSQSGTPKLGLPTLPAHAPDGRSTSVVQTLSPPQLGHGGDAPHTPVRRKSVISGADDLHTPRSKRRDVRVQLVDPYILSRSIGVCIVFDMCRLERLALTPNHMSFSIRSICSPCSLGTSTPLTAPTISCSSTRLSSSSPLICCQPSTSGRTCYATSCWR